MSNPFYPHSSGNPQTQTRGTSSTVRAEFDAVAAGFDLVSNSVMGQATESGSSNNYLLTTTPQRTAYPTNGTVFFQANHTNTGAATLQIGSLSTIPLWASDGAALNPGDIADGEIVQVNITSSAAYILGVTKAYVDAVVGSASAAAASAAAASGSAAAALASQEDIHDNWQAKLDAAAASAAAALVSEGNADISEAAAEAAQVAAESARDASFVTGPKYASEVIGRAAVADGVNFLVQGSGDIAAYEYRRIDASTVSTLIATYPSSAAIKKLGSQAPTISPWAELVVDSSMLPIRGKKKDGTYWEARSGVLVQVSAPFAQSATGVTTIPALAVSGAFSATGTPMIAPIIDLWQTLCVDSLGRPVSGIKFDGTTWTAIKGVLVRGDAARVTLPAPAYLYGYASGVALSTDTDVDYLVIVQGQSLAYGAKSSTAGDATVTTSAEHTGNALMFNVGANPNGAAVTSYVDLYEQDAGGSFETACSGMADVLMLGMQSAVGTKPRVVFCCAARSGTGYWDSRNSAEGMKRGTNTYTEALRLVSRAYTISKAASRRLVVLAQIIIHGEQDFNSATAKNLYQRALIQWRQNFSEDARRITGQPEQVRMYVSQTNRGNTTKGLVADTPWAQLTVQDQDPLIRCVGPIYQVPTGTDGSHTTGLGYRMIGRQFGNWLLNDLFGPYEDCLRVIEAYWVSTTVFRLRYSKAIAIETTDALVTVSTLDAGKGICFTDGAVTPPTITGIAIASGTTDTVEVTLASAPTGKRPKATIAMYRATSYMGATLGARSAIRSSASFTTDSRTGVVQYHWAAQEQVTLPTI